jgi:hypothetical protein
LANGETEILWRQRFCAAEKFFGASGDAPFGFSACFSLASFS